MRFAVLNTSYNLLPTRDRDRYRISCGLFRFRYRYRLSWFVGL